MSIEARKTPPYALAPAVQSQSASRQCLQRTIGRNSARWGVDGRTLCRTPYRAITRPNGRDAEPHINLKFTIHSPVEPFGRPLQQHLMSSPPKPARMVAVCGRDMVCPAWAEFIGTVSKNGRLEVKRLAGYRRNNSTTALLVR